MKKLAILLLVALLASGCVQALAEDGEGFDFSFDEEGYTGAWITVESLGLEFCLPDGWTPGEAGEDTAYVAAREDGQAALTIRVEEEGVADLAAWAGENLQDWELAEDDFLDILFTQSEGELCARVLLNDGRLTAFEFTRAGEDALPTSFALQIMGTVYEEWM